MMNQVFTIYSGFFLVFALLLLVLSGVLNIYFVFYKRVPDPSDRAALQKEIVAAEARYRHMFNMFRLMTDNMPDLLWAKDLDNKYIFTNKSTCETLLHTTDTDEPIGKTELFFAERERQKYPQRHDWHTFGKLSQDSDQAVISSLKPEHFDEYGNVNGKFLFLDVRKAPIFDENGTIIGLVGSARDVTAQKKSVSEIYKRDRLLDAISKATAMLVQGENLEESINGALKIIGNATEVNRVYIFRNYEYPGHLMPLMSQCYEWTDGSIHPLIDNPALQEVPYEISCPRWFETLSEGNVIVGNIREFPEPEKTTLSEQGIKSMLITPVFIDKKFWGFIGFDDCQIERNWTSTEERLLAAAANTIGAAYLRKINQDELIAAKEKAEESERLKSAFLANMSHEIRTPMNGILGFAGLLKEPRLTGEEQQEYISIIEKSGARMLNIINDIISISKVESGQMKVTLSKTNINGQIEYIHTFFSPEAMQKGIKLFFKNSLPEEEAIISTDKEKIYAVLTNLVKNAIKFTHAGAIEFGYLLKTNGEHPELEFFVKDTGLGIHQGQQEFIFERFRQGNEKLNRNYEGAGLGLSISKAYVEMLGGKIWVESGNGQGSVFYFTIPYNREPAVKKVLKNNVLADREENLVKNLKILIAEDDVISERLIVKAVEMFGDEILKVRTGGKAVEACRKHPDIDLVMMDIKMPEMDGYEATRQIREFNTDVVIIAQTAFALAGDKEKAIAAGCNDYISKPIDQALLIALMKKHF
jgi:PAS domain S-box-containing protein